MRDRQQGRSRGIRVSRFARRLCARYTAAIRRVSAAARVFVRPGRFVLRSSRVSVTLAVRHTPRVSVIAPAPTPRSLRERLIERSLERERVVSSAVVRILRPQAAGLVARSPRRESTVTRRAVMLIDRAGTPAVTARTAAPSSWATQKPPQMVVRRAAPAPLPAPAGSGSTVARPTPGPDRVEIRATSSRPVDAAAPIRLGPRELRELTEHVVSTLDRRALAYRERTGRI